MIFLFIHNNLFLYLFFYMILKALSKFCSNNKSWVINTPYSKLSKWLIEKGLSWSLANKLIRT